MGCVLSRIAQFGKDGREGNELGLIGQVQDTIDMLSAEELGGLLVAAFSTFPELQVGLERQVEQGFLYRVAPSSNAFPLSKIVVSRANTKAASCETA